MAHLSPPPSPPNALMNISMDGNTSSSLIQRASAFSSVLGQKWNARGKDLTISVSTLYNRKVIDLKGMTEALFAIALIFERFFLFFYFYGYQSINRVFSFDMNSIFPFSFFRLSIYL